LRPDETVQKGGSKSSIKTPRQKTNRFKGKKREGKKEGSKTSRREWGENERT